MYRQGYHKSDKIYYLPISSILPSPYQPRRSFDSRLLGELAESIRCYGVLEPILVRVMNGHIYELVSGERRLKASKMAGFESIPAILLTLGDRDVTAVAMNENIHSQPYSYLEYTEGLRVLDRGFGYSLESMSELLAKSSASFSDIYKLLSLTDEQRNNLMNADIDREQAKVLLECSDSEVRSEAIDNVCRYRLTIEQTRELMANIQRRKGIIAAADKGKAEGLSNGIKHKLVNINNIRLFTNVLKQAILILKACGVTTECKVSRLNGSCEVRIRLADEV